MANTVGELRIALAFDGKTLKASLDGVEKDVESKGSKSGSKFGNAWTIAAGNLMARGIDKAMSVVTSHIDSAIKRVDTLNNFPKVMSNLGISSDEAAKAIEKMSDKLQGLPTNLDQGAAAVQRFTSKNNDVAKSTDLFLALNNAILAGGASADLQATALEQISQAYAKGKPDMMEWRAIQSAMPAQLNQISKKLIGNKDALEAVYKKAQEIADRNPMSSTAEEMIEQLEAVKNGTGDMTTAVGTALRQGAISMDDFMNAIVDMNTEGVEGFQSLEQQAKNSTGGIQTAMAVMNSRITQGIAAVIDEIGSENIAKIAVGIGNAIKSVGKVLAGVINFVIKNWDIISPILVAVGTVAGTLMAVSTAMKVVTAAQAALNIVMAANPLGLILTALAAIITALTYFFTQTEVGKQIFQGFLDFMNGVFTAIGAAIGAVGKFFSDMWEGFRKGAEETWQGIQNIFGGIAEWFGNVFRGAWNAVKAVFETGGKIFSGIVEGIIATFKTVVNGIISGINFVVAIPFNAINGFLNILKGINILGIKPFDWVGTIAVPQIPLLAEGGYASGASQAVIGEEGKEVVLPLENNTDNWSGLLAKALADQFTEDGMSTGGGVTIENQNINIDSKLDAENIGHIMMQSIRRQAR